MKLSLYRKKMSRAGRNGNNFAIKLARWRLFMGDVDVKLSVNGPFRP